MAYLGCELSARTKVLSKHTNVELNYTLMVICRRQSEG